MTRGPAGCQDRSSTINKNVIIYTGVAHVEIYKQVIQEYFKCQPIINERHKRSNCFVYSKPFDFHD